MNRNNAMALPRPNGKSLTKQRQDTLGDVTSQLFCFLWAVSPPSHPTFLRAVPSGSPRLFGNFPACIRYCSSISEWFYYMVGAILSKSPVSSNITLYYLEFLQKPLAHFSACLDRGWVVSQFLPFMFAKLKIEYTTERFSTFRAVLLIFLVLSVELLSRLKATFPLYTG